MSFYLFIYAFFGAFNNLNLFTEMKSDLFNSSLLQPYTVSTKVYNSIVLKVCCNVWQFSSCSVTHMHSQGSSHCWKHYRKGFYSSTSFKVC